MTSARMTSLAGAAAPGFISAFPKAAANQAVVLQSLRNTQLPECEELQSVRYRSALNLGEAAANAKLQRTPEEQRQLERKIALIARVFSKNYEMRVLPAPAGGWACGVAGEAERAAHEYLFGDRKTLDDLKPEVFKPSRIYYDVADIASAPRDEVFGVLRHEVGHANHSDFRLLFEGQKNAQNEGFLPTSWLSIHNALEDPWVNNLEIRGSDVVRRQMTALYAARFPEIVEKIGTQPVTHQLGLNINYYWATGKSIPTITDKRVIEAFEKMRPHVDAYFSGKSAKENFDNLKRHIWPIYKELESKAIADEARRDLARSLSQGGRGRGRAASGTAGRSGGGTDAGASPSASQQSPSGTGLDDAQSDGSSRRRSLGGRVVQAVRRIFGLGDEEPKAPRRPRGRRGQGAESFPKSTAAENRSPIEQLQDEIEEQRRRLESKDRELERTTGKKPLLEPDIDLEKLSRQAQRALEDEEQKATTAERQQRLNQARAALDRKQAELQRRVGPRSLAVRKTKDGVHVMSYGDPASASDESPAADTSAEGMSAEKPPPQPDSGQPSQQADPALGTAEEQRIFEELIRRAEQLKQDPFHETEPAPPATEAVLDEASARRAAELKQEIAKRDRARNGFSETEQQHFRRFRELESAMQGYVTTFIRNLEGYLPRKDEHSYDGEHYSGRRLNTRALPSRVPIGDLRIYQRRRLDPTGDPRLFVTLLIDNSGSMEGQKMEESLKTAVFWSRVLKEFQVPFSIKFFGSKVVPIKEFEQDYDHPGHRIKPHLVIKADASGGHTDMGAPLSQTKSELTRAKRRYHECKGAVFVISDSGANAGLVGEGLRKLIAELQEDHIVMNFLLGGQAGEIEAAKQLFGTANVVAPKRFGDLPREAFRVLRTTLDRVMKSYQAEH